MKRLAATLPFSRSGQARQGYPIGVVAVASVVLVGTAFGLSIWRYENAQENGRAALTERADQLRSQQAAKVFWHEREAINEYLLTGRPEVLSEINSLRAEFQQLTEGLAEGDAIQMRAVARLRAANARFLGEFDRRRADRRDIQSQLKVIAGLHPLEEVVLLPLRALEAVDREREQAALSRAAAASRQARIVAILGVLLGLGAGLGFAVYASRLLRQVTRQARALEQTLAERERAQEALYDREGELRQAQKMEAVGHLTGGVAHDFNNVLMAIMGYSDLASAEVGRDQAVLRHNIDQIKAAATLGTALTGQLLAFSRQQVVQQRVLDLNDEIEGLAAMLGPCSGRRSSWPSSWIPRGLRSRPTRGRSSRSS